MWEDDEPAEDTSTVPTTYFKVEYHHIFEYTDSGKTAALKARERMLKEWKPAFWILEAIEITDSGWRVVFNIESRQDGPWKGGQESYLY